MDGRQNQQNMQGYTMNFNDQQAFLQEQQYRLIAQQQYINNLNVSSIYNNPHIISQSVDMQQLRQQQLLQAALSQQQQMQYIGQSFVDQPHLQQSQLCNSVNPYQQPSLAQPVAQHVTNPADIYRQNNVSVQNPLLLQQQQQQQRPQSQSTAAHNIIQPQPQHVQPRPVQIQQNLRPTLQQHQTQQQPSQQTNQNRAYIESRSEVGTARNENSNLQQQQAAALNASIQNKLLLQQKEEAAEAERRERERRERERAEEELRRRREEAQEFAKDLTERISSFPQPLHFANCHTLTKVSAIIPLPSECTSTSATLPCFEQAKAAEILNTTDSMLAQMLSDCLNECFEDIREIELKHEEEETSDIDLSRFPPLIQSIYNYNEFAFNTDFTLNDHEINLAAIEHDLQEVVAQVTANEAGDQHHENAFSNHESDTEHPLSEHNENDQLSKIAKEESSVDVSALVAHQSREQAQLRKQMVSVGKQPKAAPNRRKRDMVEALYDSLTGYFDPSSNRRSRRNKNYEEDGEKNEMHSRDSQEKEIPESMDIEGPSTSTDEPEPKFFDRGSKKSRKRHRKDSDSEMNRPPTPTEVIQQREVEWSERQRQRQEKHRRRQTESDADYWNNDVLAENESIVKFGNLIDQIFEQVEDMDVLQSEEAGVLTDRVQLEELRIEGQKLKAWRKLNKFNTDRLIKLLTLLEKSISDVLSEDGSLIVSYITNEADDESDETYRELINERLVRAADAACTALTIMTAPRMPKQVLIEDTIERAVQMCKQFLQHIVYPSSDVVCRTGSKAKRVSDDRVKKRKSAFDSSLTSQMIYTRMAELISCFSELVRFQNLNETVIIQLCTLATGPFFVDNIGEIQMQSIKLISTIFSRYAGMRKSILQDLLNSLHRLPSMKNQKNCYRLSNADTIHNFTVLILQLVQSIVKLPIKKRTSDEENDEQNDILPEDTAVIDSYEEAQKMAAFFLGGFLTKCTAKSEDDYRRLFEQFLRDLLASLYRPEWPVAEMMLTILGNLLVKYYRSKMEISLRVASLEYLGTITARLRKDKVSAMNDANSTFEKTRLDLVVKGILFDEQVDQTKTLDEIDTSNLSSSDKMRKIEQALIDYIIGSRGDGDVSVEYAIMFYVGEWYKETVEDMEMAKERHRQFTQEDHPEKEVRKHERKLQKLMEKGENMKSFVLSLADKKHLKKRHQYIMKTGNIMIDSDALWAVKYLASKREFSQSFNNYLKMILYGVQLEPAVQLRTKAMKCLTQIIEADHEVLLMADVHNAVQARMTDTNVAVREATIELIGKYLVSRPDLLNKYYTILMERIKDTGVAVRKRVIRILREIVEKQPDIDKVPEILARIIRRITDEEGIKKLCIETFQNIWFVPVNERSSELLLKKVTTMADTIEVCVSENMSEYFETLVGAILKNNSDKSAIHACRQIVDCLIDNILTLDSKVVDEGQKFENANSETNSTVTRTSLGRLLASLTTLSAFCKIRPELMVKHAEVLLPYLSTISSSSSSELQVLNQVINMLERVVPLMDHPSDTFLSTLDERLGLLIRDKGMVIIASAVACMSASFKKWRKPKPAICEIFLLYLKYLNNVRSKIEAMPTYKLPEAKKPTIMRFLYTLGLSIRHFNFDEILVDDEEAKASAKSLDSAALKGSIPAGDDDSNNGSENRIFCNLVYSILLFNSRSSDSGIRLKALTALGNMTAEYTDFLTRQEIRNMYIFCLQAEEPSYLPNKIQVLKNLSMFLQSEEQKAIKTNEQMQQLKNKEAEDLKEMELHTSGLSAAIIQIYWNPVMNCYFHPQEEVRTSVVQVVWQTLQQGLVTPGSSIPTLISMSTDSLPNIRTKVENLLKEIDTKYAGMLPSKAVIGVRMSFRLQKYIKRDSNKIIRGIRQCEHSAGATLDQNGLPKSVNDGQAILGGLYSMLRMNRQQRRSFLSALLRLFSENSTEKLGLEEWVFVADNLAMFPYQVLDEPLYVIHQAELITSTTGQDILSGLKQLLLPRRISQTGQPEDDDEEFTSEIIYRRLPEDKSKIYELMRKSHACFLLLYIKTFLMKLYGFNESKVQEYSPSEAAKVYEKPVTRKNVSVFNPEMTLQELLPGVIATRDTIEGHINLSQQIVYFRNMLLSLDKMDYDEDEEEMDQESSTLLEKTDVNNETAEPIEEE